MNTGNRRVNSVVSNITQALRAIYDFFAGDISILAGTSVAFVGAFLLLHWGHAPNALVAVLFVAFLLAGLTDSVNRAIGGHRRS